MLGKATWEKYAISESTEPRREEIPGTEICCEHVYTGQGSQGGMPWGAGIYHGKAESL